MAGRSLVLPLLCSRQCPQRRSTSDVGLGAHREVWPVQRQFRNGLLVCRENANRDLAVEFGLMNVYTSNDVRDSCIL